MCSHSYSRGSPLTYLSSPTTSSDTRTSSEKKYLFIFLMMGIANVYFSYSERQGWEIIKSACDVYSARLTSGALFIIISICTKLKVQLIDNIERIKIFSGKRKSTKCFPFQYYEGNMRGKNIFCTDKLYKLEQ